MLLLLKHWGFPEGNHFGMLMFDLIWTEIGTRVWPFFFFKFSRMYFVLFIRLFKCTNFFSKYFKALSAFFNLLANFAWLKVGRKWFYSLKKMALILKV